MLTLIYHWIDLLWIPIVFFLVHERHRWWALGFAIACSTMMHLQVEIMTSIGYQYGLMGILPLSAYTRGLIVYSLFYILFLLLAHFSPRTQGVVFMAACLAIFFMVFFTSMITMVL